MKQNHARIEKAQEKLFNQIQDAGGAKEGKSNAILRKIVAFLQAPQPTPFRHN